MAQEDMLSYKNAFCTICKGFVMLGRCLWRTFVNCAIDLAKCYYKHPIAAALIIAVLAYCLYTTATARAERDHLARQSYAQEVTIDSLEVLLTK